MPSLNANRQALVYSTCFIVLVHFLPTFPVILSTIVAARITLIFEYLLTFRKGRSCNESNLKKKKWLFYEGAIGLTANIPLSILDLAHSPKCMIYSRYSSLSAGGKASLTEILSMKECYVLILEWTRSCIFVNSFLNQKLSTQFINHFTWGVRNAQKAYRLGWWGHQGKDQVM